MGNHVCNTAEEGWRPCPADLCEGESLLSEIKQLKQQLETLERQRKHEYFEKSPSYFQMVKRFHEAYGLDINDVPINATEATKSGLYDLRENLHKEEWQELQGAMDGFNLVEMADAICDLIYVLCGTAVSFGIPLDECFAEVQRSNMSKLMPDGSVYRREDGKILKGPNFSPPDLRSIIYGTSSS